MNNKKTFKNIWIENEVRSLKTEMKCGRHNNNMVYRMLAMSIFLLILTVGAFAEDIVCPHCYSYIQIESVSMRYFPDTWRCSNQKCRYENYDGIDYCALCGTKRKG